MSSVLTAPASKERFPNHDGSQARRGAPSHLKLGGRPVLRATGTGLYCAECRGFMTTYTIAASRYVIVTDSLFKLERGPHSNASEYRKRRIEMEKREMLERRLRRRSASTEKATKQGEMFQRHQENGPVRNRPLTTATRKTPQAAAKPRRLTAHDFSFALSPRLG
jgi:hypothetical protein